MNKGVKTKANKARVRKWLKEHKVEIRRVKNRRCAILMKCTQKGGIPWINEDPPDDFEKSPVRYVVGKRVVAPDWDGGIKECGKGLHFSDIFHDEINFTGACAYGCDSIERIRNHYIVAVPIDEIVVHSDPEFRDKVKAKSCYVLKRIA